MKKFIIIIAFGISLGQSTIAVEPSIVVLNPDSIRHQLLENNISLERAFDQVQDAKDKVSLARANLLPSVNLGGMLTLTGIPTFMVSAVQFLLPFLMPSNWFNAAEEKNLYEAEKISYQVMELNVYGSALSLYYTILNDQQMKQVYEAQANDFQQIAKVLEAEYRDFGLVSKEDLAHAQAEASLSQIQASHLAELLSQEIASLRSALGLPLEAVLQLDPSLLPESPRELGSIQDAITEAEAISPEFVQIQYLVKAAKNARWSKVFGFLGGVSLGNQVSPSSTTGVSFGSLRASGSMSIGLGIFPTLKISNRNIQEVELQKEELKLQLTQVFEATLNSLKEAKKQASLADSAYQAMKTVSEGKREQYDLGLCSFLTLLMARTQTTAAQVTSIQAKTGLNLLRVTLHRALLSDQFQKVRVCKPSDEQADARGLSLDEFCRDSSSTPIVRNN